MAGSLWPLSQARIRQGSLGLPPSDWGWGPRLSGEQEEGGQGLEGNKKVWISSLSDGNFWKILVRVALGAGSWGNRWRGGHVPCSGRSQESGRSSTALLWQGSGGWWLGWG